jgi:hypothetical protein
MPGASTAGAGVVAVELGADAAADGDVGASLTEMPGVVDAAGTDDERCTDELAAGGLADALMDV